MYDYLFGVSLVQERVFVLVKPVVGILLHLKMMRSFSKEFCSL